LERKALQDAPIREKPLTSKSSGKSPVRGGGKSDYARKKICTRARRKKAQPY